jgi:hypothetical protein
LTLWDWFKEEPVLDLEPGEREAYTTGDILVVKQLGALGPVDDSRRTFVKFISIFVRKTPQK